MVVGLLSSLLDRRGRGAPYQVQPVPQVRVTVPLAAWSSVSVLEPEASRPTPTPRGVPRGVESEPPAVVARWPGRNYQVQPVPQVRVTVPSAACASV